MPKMIDPNSAPRFDGSAPGSHQQREVPVSEQWRAHSRTDWGGVPRRMGKLVGLLFGYSLYGTVALTALTVLLLFGAILLGGGSNG